MSEENRSFQFLVGTTGQWAQQQSALSWYALGFQLGAHFEANLNDSLSLAVGLGMTPQRASKSLVEFLDVGSPSGEVYRWVDDGDWSLRSTSVASLCDALMVHIIGEAVIGCRIT